MSHLSSRAALALVVGSSVGWCAPAFAGGTGDQVLIIADPLNAESMYAANYYKRARGVPDENVLYIYPGATNFGDFTGRNVDALLGTLVQRGIEHVDYVLVMPGAPFFISAPGLVSDGCSPVTRFSMSSIYTMAQITGDILGGGNDVTDESEYYSANADAISFESETNYLNGVPSASTNARGYFIGAMLGYTGERGNTLPELFAMVDRSVAADGTHPAGTFYFMDNQADPNRNVRAPLYPIFEADLTALGANVTILQGEVPGGNHDCLGVMTGAARPNITGGFTVLDGSFADHLTSWAGTFDLQQQRKMSEWITKGCSGTYGEVQEPCNYLGKFPRPSMHPLYFQGNTLGEAVFRSLRFIPFQGLLYGDPLTRPFAFIPVVNVADAPAGTVSGSVTLTPNATTAHPSALIDFYDLHIDGVLLDTVNAGGAFSLDTTALSDGHHRLTVLAYDDSPVATDGRWVGSIDVDNSGVGATLSSSAASGDYTTTFDLTVGASGGSPAEARVWHNGRIVASATSLPATLGVAGRVLGAGVNDLHAEILFADGSSARSTPIQIDVADAETVPDGAAPLAFGYSRTVENQDPVVLELPSSFQNALGDATWTVTGAPSQATVHTGPDGPYRVIVPDSNASGTDTLTFRVNTSSGQSQVATITLNYLDTACRVDVAPPFGVLDFFDTLGFLFLFDNLDPAADLSPPFGQWDFFDVLEFLTQFDAGCP